MGLRDEMKESAKEMAEAPKKVEELREEVQALREEVQGLRPTVSRTQDDLEKMTELLKRSLKSMKVVEETSGVLGSIQNLRSAAEEAKAEISRVKWTTRIRTAMWAAATMVVVLILAMSILWTSSTLSLQFLPRNMVLSEEETLMLNDGRRFRRAFRGLSEEDRNRVDKILKKGERAVLKGEEGKE